MTVNDADVPLSRLDNKRQPTYVDLAEVRPSTDGIGTYYPDELPRTPGSHGNGSRSVSAMLPTDRLLGQEAHDEPRPLSDGPPSHGDDEARLVRNGEPGPPHPADRKRLSRHDWWLWEIVSMCLAAASWLATVALLASVDGKQWTSNLSLNAVVSVLTLLGRAGTLVGVSAAVSQAKWRWFARGSRPLHDMQRFDAASRSVIGSMRFLVSVRWQLATVGAAITVLAVLVDPFAQQVVDMETRAVGFADPAAAFSFAHGYVSGTMFSAQPDGRALQVDLPTMDVSMLGSILRGLFGLPQALPYSCPGSCQWPDNYVSLGFSSQCQNVTQITTATGDCALPGRGSGGQNCTFTTPGGVRFQAFISDTVAQTAANVVAAGHAFNIGDDAPVSPRDFVRFAVFRAPGDRFNAGMNLTIWGQEIYECSLSITAFSYANVSVNGTSVQNGDGVDLGLSQPGVLQNKASSDGGSYVFTEPGLPVLNISKAAWVGINQFFASPQFSGALATGDTSLISDQYGMASISLVHAPDIRAVFADVARAMTLQVQMSAGAQKGTGLANRDVAIVRVRWAYLVLPLGVTAAAAALLATSIVVNRRGRGVPLWKESPVALLYFTVRERDGVLATGFDGPAAVDRAARRTRVRLE